MRASSLVLVATLVMTICVGTAAAGPPGMSPPAPPAKKGITPGGATIISGLVVVVGSLTAAGSVFSNSCDCDHAARMRDVAVGFSIIMFGPTLVRLPAREVGGAHLAIRLAGAAVIFGADASEIDDATPYLIGAGLVFGGAISDLVTVNGAYRRWNERHALSVVPATVSPSGAVAPGVSLGGRF